MHKFIEWYESLPISHRQDIAAVVGTYCPGFGKVGIGTEIDILPELFKEVVKDYQDGGFRELGATLSLRSFIQVVFIDRRADRNGWKETQDLLSSLAREKESETFQRMAKEVPFKAEQWIVTCEKWNKLVASDLSDQNIKALLPC
ncbi:MAG TPA: hypothetical protein VFP33_13410 [Gallionella sp.]|nr:hypothetical protein [Gallionella sp.]